MAPASRAQGSVGVYDSGIGGGSVLRHLHRLLPAEDLLYLADQARLPYGPRPAAELRLIAAECAAWLIGRSAKLVVVACNSASAAALTHLRASFPDTPFVGMVPAVKPAAGRTRSGVVGVLATPATIAGGLLHEVVERWAGGVRVLEQACPGLVELVEAGAPDTPESAQLLAGYLGPLVAAGADTIVLGCTHYPFLAPQIRRIVGPDVALLDAGPAVARRAAEVLASHGLAHPDATRRGAIVYATTGDAAHLAALIARLGLPPGSVMTADTTRV